MAVNGLWGFDNNFLLDGVDNNAIGDGTIAVNPSPDAIGEFRVEENSMKAEFGRGGAAVNAALKSGTNHVPWRRFEYMRNDVLDARNYFDPASNGPKARLQRNQFGADIGGPIIKDRTFFFGDYQGSRLREVGLISEPFPRQRSARAISPIEAICSTIRTRPIRSTGARQLLNPSNPTVIPSNRIDQIGQNIVNLFPMPNIAGAGHYEATLFYTPSQLCPGTNSISGLITRSATMTSCLGMSRLRTIPSFSPRRCRV